MILAAILLQSGLYQCVKGNAPSICDQQVRVYQTEGKLTALKIEYVGECGSMGPYLYPCENNECGDAGIHIKIGKNQSYIWTNRGYGFTCRFERKKRLAL